MITSTHGLAGFVMGKAFVGDREGWYGTLYMTIVSLLPDADLFLRWFGTNVYLTYHRALTNSVVLFPFFAVLVALLFWLPDRSKSFRSLLGWGALAWLVHIFLDLANTFGVPVLFPFDWTYRMRLNLLFIVDLLLSGLLLLPILHRLIAGRWSTYVARLSVCTALLYISFCFVNQQLAYWHLQKRINAPSRIQQGIFMISTSKRSEQAAKKSSSLPVQQIENLHVTPQPLLPFRWSGIITHKNGKTQIFINSLTGEKYTENRFFPKFSHEMNALKQRVSHNRTAHVFWHFAFHPVVTRVTDEFVEISDLQFHVRPTPEQILPSLFGPSKENNNALRLPFTIRMKRHQQEGPSDVIWTEE